MDWRSPESDDLPVQFKAVENNVWGVNVRGGFPGAECVRCRENMARVRQSRPDSGLGFQVKVLETFQVVSSSLGNDIGGAAAEMLGMAGE